MALQHQIAPPTLRLEQPGEDCCLDYLPHTPRAMRIDQALSNTFGFGGSNVSLLFREANGTK
jgi:3-oxoacyl-[acyl-carrier-protein] synthase II